MGDPEPRRGRTHDAEGAREAILNAAEEVFAQHGFDGARIAAIATAAGYNSSLIFQYFEDKLNLYAEVLKRSDRETQELQVLVLSPLLEDETTVFDARRFRIVLKKIVEILFDYLIEHPLLMRILLWEMAEGWQTYAKIASQFSTEDAEAFEKLFRRGQDAGWIRVSFHPMMQLSLALQVCQSYIAFLPLYQMLLPNEDLTSKTAIAQAKEQIILFVVSGIMIDSEEAQL